MNGCLNNSHRSAIAEFRQQAGIQSIDRRALFSIADQQRQQSFVQLSSDYHPAFLLNSYSFKTALHRSSPTSEFLFEANNISHAFRRTVRVQRKFNNE